MVMRLPDDICRKLEIFLHQHTMYSIRQCDYTNEGGSPHLHFDIVIHKPNEEQLVAEAARLLAESKHAEAPKMQSRRPRK